MSVVVVAVEEVKLKMLLCNECSRSCCSRSSVQVKLKVLLGNECSRSCCRRSETENAVM